MDLLLLGGGVTIVTITPHSDEQTGDETYTADKTYAELSAIIENGGYVIADETEGGYYHTYYFMSSYSVPNEGLVGYVGFTTASSEPSGVKAPYISIDSDGSVTKQAS